MRADDGVAERCWISFGVPGIGQVSTWADKSILDVHDFDGGGDRIEVECISAVMPMPGNRIAVQKLAERGVMNLATCGGWFPTAPDIVEMLSRAWDRVTTATPEERGKILRGDR